MGRHVRRVVGGAAMVVALLSSIVLTAPVTVAAERADAQARRTPIVTSSAPFLMPMEDYSGYQPQTRCQRRAKPGVLALADWLVARGGGYGPISRSCAGSSTSEHKESRAFDWMLDASEPADVALAQAFLDEVLAPDDTGQPHALARRMGVMYIIWNDRMWASYDGFQEKRYLSSGCRSRRRCSTTLRHRDHVHISLSRKGAKGLTSWYAALTFAD